ncbi:protein-methionine-sulfoxide reductase heme-binding subunit MsrQ [Swingsia samuiensis]|uniref:protein-methionine-sulfoxide reductase heme-binding subunit MsrQ n=1 Tax=Swingsia samuiensis TaxID=1293412 RepID=UPI001FE6B82A|nr:protein-methionine-sulfoxide reductase heme-binding subunit MsrQ [Swingsia samuiensis]
MLIFKKNWRVLLYGIGLIPALYLLWQGQTGRLGADPVNVFERALGLWAFRFLLVCFALSPLQVVSGMALKRYQRLTGLLAFIYAILHLGAYLFLDLQMNFSIFARDVTHRPFIILGMLAVLILLPMALTSNRLSMRLLKKKWKKIHSLIYVAVPLVLAHFYLSFKVFNKTIFFYLFITSVVVFLRFILTGFPRKQSF